MDQLQSLLNAKLFHTSPCLVPSHRNLSTILQSIFLQRKSVPVFQNLSFNPAAMASPDKMKNVLILGATGPLGLLAVEEFLSQGYLPTLFVRNPSKLPQEIKDNPSVTIITSPLESASTTLFPQLSKFSAIVSALGPVTTTDKTKMPLKDFYAELLKYLSSLPEGSKKSNPYIIALATPSQPDPRDSFNFVLWLAVLLLRFIVRPTAYNEIRAIANVFLTYGNDLQWTLYRVGALKDNPETGNNKMAVAGYVADGTWQLNTSRTQIARWLFKQVELVQKGDEEGMKWIQQLPTVSGV